MSTSSQFAVPQTIEEATALLAELGVAARIVAGGTDLMVQARITGSYPEHYVDIKHIAETNVIDLQADYLQLGAGVPCAVFSERSDIRAAFPGLVEASELIGSTQIQSRATSLVPLTAVVIASIPSAQTPTPRPSRAPPSAPPKTVNRSGAPSQSANSRGATARQSVVGTPAFHSRW